MKKIFEKYKIDGLIIYNLANIKYLTGFSGSNGVCIINDHSFYLLTDSRYAESAKREVKANVIIKIIDRNLTEINFNNYQINNLGFESNITYDQYQKLKQQNLKITPIPAKELLMMRSIKNNEELTKIKNVTKILMNAFKEVSKIIKPGITTEADVAAFMYQYGFNHNIDDLAFEIIAVSGNNTSMPHGIPSNNIIQPNTFLTIDCGFSKDGYTSDITRTFAIGNVSYDMKKHYELVKEANELAIKKIKPGIKAKDVHNLVVDFFKEHHVNNYFIHGLGHSLGSEVHEAPYLNNQDDSIIEVGQVFTIEPGLYFTGNYGIRIEDMIYIDNERVINLTKDLSHELQVINPL